MNSTIDFSGAMWEKSSYSNGAGGQCVECARTMVAEAGVLPVRDSKRPEGPVLTFTPDAWQRFVQTFA